MNLKLTELRAITDRLFTYSQDTGREEFDVEDDDYWEISKEELRGRERSYCSPAHYGSFVQFK